MGCTLFWVKFGNAFAYFVVSWFRVYYNTSKMALLFNINFYFDCKIRLFLIIPGRHEKIYLCTRKFLYTRYTQDINEQGTSFLDCKHKHVIKCGAPPDKFGVLSCMFTYRFHKQN